MDTNDRKAAARAWFETLRDEIHAGLEALDAAGDAALYGAAEAPALFERTAWARGEGPTDEGGGLMGILKGRVFEKAGVHTSTVQGEFSPEFRKQIPGAEEDPRFWASGISLIVHPTNPHVPAVHMNTRMIVTSKMWFGGGGDLNPMHPAYRVRDHEDTAIFLAPYRDACDRADPSYFDRFHAWCDEYFWLPHRQEPRGVGGIFYDHLESGDWQGDFRFTQDVGRAFLEAYRPLVEKRMHQEWSEEDRMLQLRQRGRYAEFNLLYDRGTVFGLKTGGNVESILSSLPPLARWD